MLPVSENPVCRKPAFGITYSPAPVPLEDRGYLTTFGRARVRLGGFYTCCWKISLYSSATVFGTLPSIFSMKPSVSYTCV